MLPNDLTPKQARFTQAIIKQIEETGTVNGTKAAQETLDVTSPENAASRASELFRVPKVKQTIQEALAESGLTPHIISGRLKHLATTTVEKVSADTQLRSIVEILKLTGAYPTQKHANVSLSVRANLGNMQYGDLEKEVDRINGEIQELIEGKPVPDDASDVAHS